MINHTKENRCTANYNCGSERREFLKESSSINAVALLFKHFSVDAREKDVVIPETHSLVPASGYQYNSQFFIVSLITIIFAFGVSCKDHSSSSIQELKPWHDAIGPEINERFTTEYMRSRPPRMVKKIYQNWTFYYFPNADLDEHTADMEFDDSKWPAIAIPHSWHNYETTRQLHPFILNASEKESGYFRDTMGVGNPAYWWNGWGWYREKFKIIIPVQNKRLFLEFDGVMKYCRVYLNGHYLGDHKGGFNSFYFEITDYVKQGQINTIAVAVRNKQDDEFRIPPMYSGNQTHSGGIYRDVRIIVKDQVYIPFQGSYLHEGGTFITTPIVNNDSAIVNVKTWVKNDTKTIKEVLLRTTIEDANQKEICSITSNKIIDAGNIAQIEQTLPIVKNPMLWSPDSPNLYKVLSFVFVNGVLMDHYESPLGIRTFVWDYSRNVGILNGKPIHIHGTNRTQGFPWLNNAIPSFIDVLDIRDIRFGLGHNFIRPGVHPNNFLIHDLFDQWGMLVDLSSPMIKDIDFSEEVQEQMIREAVRQNRNRPSIIFYSVGNETNDGADSKWVYEEDTTRIIHARKVSGGKGDFVTHDHTNMDMENLLRVTIRGWTDNDIYPENPINGQQAGNQEWQHDRAIVQDGSIRGRIDMPNGVMWMYSDDGAARVYKNCPLKNINPKGWVDPYRIPKYIYFLWQANYILKPMVFIHPHFWQEKYIGTRHDFVIDSNCDTVTLFINNKKIGTQYPGKGNFHIVQFKNILVEKGTLKAIGKKQGKEFNFILPMAGKPVSLLLKTSHYEIQAARSSIVAITVDAIDSKGTQIQTFNNPLEWEVTGPATLIGPSHWETDIHKNVADSGNWYITTPVLNLIRSNGESGAITVKVSSPGVKSATIKINAIPVKNDQNGFIKELVLTNKGRMPVKWNAAYEKSDMKVPKKMNHIDFDFHLESGKVYGFYMKYFIDFIKAKDPDMTLYPVLLETIAEHFTKHILTNNGTLVADDYNFIVERINNYLNKVAGQDRNESMKELADKEYLKRVVREGNF